MTSDQPEFGQGPFSGPPPEQTQAAQTQPAQTQPAQTQPAQTQPAQTQPAQTQPAQTQYGQQAQYGSAPAYGQPQNGQAMPYTRTARGTNALAITALCCGIGQIILGPLAGIPAVITGFMSLGQIARTGEDGRGMAIAGLVLGIIGLLLTALFIILFVVAWNHVTSSQVMPAG